jgi:hypothetical protein
MIDQSTQPQIAPNPHDGALLREKLQQDIVAIITRKLESGEMTEERAKAIAKMTLEKLPENLNYKQIMEVLPTLDDEFHELKAAVIPVLMDYQQKISNQVEIQITSLLKEQKYQDALKLAQKAVEFESKLG